MTKTIYKWFICVSYIILAPTAPSLNLSSADFELSDAQHQHALAVERLAPRLASLRMELCPGYMSDGRFWKIYFVLLHPRLNKQDVELLSSPEVS